jgi:hypothetical protein
MYNISPSTFLNFVEDENLDNGREYCFGNLKLPPWVSSSPLLSPFASAGVLNPIFLSPDKSLNSSPQESSKNEKITKEVQNENS